MAVVEVLDLLRCPLCEAVFTADGGGVRCAAGHRFDLARHGYLNLLGAAPPQHADTGPMVAARERFLAGGGYAPVAQALVAAARDGLLATRGSLPTSPALLEAGAGTGYYTAALLAGLGGRAVAMDISVAAARRAARAHRRVAAVVADVWGRLPLAPGCLDVVASVFAPRNPAEFSRVLRADGVLVVVTPLPEHLQELRDDLSLLQLEPAKQERLATSLDAGFSPAGEVAVRYSVAWSAAEVVDLVAMGPNAFHLDPAEVATRTAGLAEPVRTQVAVAVSTWTKRSG